ncbi:hypothetical protein LMG22931_05032 [Paraburkholderia nemoris]|nr:hypothetical protein LMG22931_05032 [Paraburkholderia nemoris]
MPGSGEGSLSCCYALKGTEFIVRWDYYDADQWQLATSNCFTPRQKYRCHLRRFPSRWAIVSSKCIFTLITTLN